MFKRALFLFFLSTITLIGSSQNNDIFLGDYFSMVRVYDDDGVLVSEINYINGLPTGEYRYFYQDGTIMEEGTWKNNHQVGEFKRYYKNGRLAQNFYFDNSGKRIGTQKYYYPNGSVAAEKQIGKKEGKYTIIRFTKDGKQKSFITL